MDEQQPMPETVESNLPAGRQGQTPSFLSRYKFTIISLCVILLALIPLIIIAKQHKASSPTTPTTAVAQPSSTPTPVPLSQQNAQPTLSATDSNIQSAITQSNQDLNSVNQIDTSQDSTAGL